MKNHISLALLGLVAVGASAQAQSSVTLFGVADIHARTLKNGSASGSSLASGGESSSRFGLRGVEDLGGGLKAGFWFEAPVNVDSGTAGATSGGVDRFWNRRATLSLSGSWGEIRGGRDTLPSWTALSNFDVFGTVGVGSLANLYPDASAFGALTRVRADNALAYFLPDSLGGVYGSFAVAPSEGTLGAKYAGGRIGYRAEALNVTTAYGQSEVTAQDNHKVFVLSGSYDLGAVKLHGVAQQNRLNDAKRKLYYVGLTAPVGQGQIKASYARTTGEGVTGSTNLNGLKANQFALGYVHSLSKRTAVYTTLSVLKNEGSARYTVGGISGYSQKAGENSRGLDIGIRHTF